MKLLRMGDNRYGKFILRPINNIKTIQFSHSARSEKEKALLLTFTSTNLKLPKDNNHITKSLIYSSCYIEPIIERDIIPLSKSLKFMELPARVIIVDRDTKNLNPLFTTSKKWDNQPGIYYMSFLNLISNNGLIKDLLNNNDIPYFFILDRTSLFYLLYIF